MASIHFFSFAQIVQRNGKLDSALASARYRIVIPATQLARRGNSIHIGVIPWNAVGPVDVKQVKGDIVVYSKCLGGAALDLAQSLRKLNRPLIVDLCDNYFQHDRHGTKHRDEVVAMCKLATRVIASTPRMAELILENTGVEAQVISDPVEGDKQAAKFEPRFPRVKLLWFGHPTNWSSIIATLPSLAELNRTLPIELTLITRYSDAEHDALKKFAAEHGASLRILSQEWHPDIMPAALEACDIVIIPSGESDFQAAKSPNRVFESLWAGRHVVAHPVPSYEPFRDFAWLGSDIATGIRESVENARDIPARIARGQTYIEQHHSPYVIGNQWEAALDLVPEQRPLRLNLGCGDKILPGYVNVDVVASRKGQKPDVLCDLHHLTPFADNSVDEILSVHVVEHFWRWEVRDILKEWVRVLKPGGKIILECPNLESACKHFLDNPELHSREDQNGQRSMWVFYGDPAWKDPYMIHRWGYTPASLAELMKEAGLADIKQEPAQFKLREPRDMRVTASKPV